MINSAMLLEDYNLLAAHLDTKNKIKFFQLTYDSQINLDNNIWNKIKKLRFVDLYAIKLL